MNIVVATDGNDQNEYFVTKFFTEGFTPYKALGSEELTRILSTKEPDMLVLDYDSEKYEKLETVKKVKLAHNNILIILLTYKSDFQFVKQAHELGVFAIIPKLEDASRQFIEIIESLNNIKNRREEKRKYIRVTPDPSQRNVVRMRIPGIQTIYQGLVKDISLGGMLIEINDIISDSILYKGKIIIASIELDTFSLKAECNVVLKRGQEVGYRFQKLNDVNVSNLSRYILTRLQ